MKCFLILALAFLSVYCQAQRYEFKIERVAEKVDERDSTQWQDASGKVLIDVDQRFVQIDDGKKMRIVSYEKNKRKSKHDHAYYYIVVKKGWFKKTYFSFWLSRDKERYSSFLTWHQLNLNVHYTLRQLN